MTQQINLIAPSLIPQREWLHGRSIALILAIVTVAVAGHAWLEHSATRALLASAAATAPPPEAPASAPPDELTQLLTAEQTRVARSEQLMQAMASLTDLPQNSAQRLTQLVAALPETAWLQEVEFSGAKGVRIVGGSTRADTLAGLAQRLNQTPGYAGLPLQVFALSTSEAEADGAEGSADVGTQSQATPPPGADDDAPVTLARKRLPERYGFVLSSPLPPATGMSPEAAR